MVLLIMKGKSRTHEKQQNLRQEQSVDPNIFQIQTYVST